MIVFEILVLFHREEKFSLLGESSQVESTLSFDSRYFNYPHVSDWIVIFQPSLTSHTRSVVHDVPVGVIPQRNWEEYEEPAMPDFDVSIQYRIFELAA